MENIFVKLLNDMKNTRSGKKKQVTEEDVELSVDTVVEEEEQTSSDLSLETKNNSSVQMNIDEIENKEKELTEEEKKLLEETKQTVSQQKTKKKKIWSVLSVIFNVGIVVAILLIQIFASEESVMPLTELFRSGINWWCLIACFLLFFIVNATNAWRLQVLIKDSTKKNRPALAYKTAAIGRYYDDITPLGSGGQPFQIYYLTKRGVDGSSALSIPLGSYIVSQSVLVIVSLIIMFSSIITVSIDSTTTVVVSVASWIGVIANLVIVASILFVSINRTTGTKIISGGIKFLHKIKIVKNYDKQYNKAMKFIDDYQKTLKHYAKSKKTFVWLIIITLTNLLCHYSIPFFIYSALSGVVDFAVWWNIVTKCIMIDMAAAIMPVPGGAGAVELSFTALFASFFTDGKLFWAILLWRILAFYGYIIQGLIIILYDFLWGDKKHKWLEKKWALESESNKFKNQHYEEFENSLIKKEKTVKRRVKQEK